MLAAVLVLLLGHESYAVRDASEAGLLACPTIPAILSGTLSPDPERQSRSVRLLDAFQGDFSPIYIDSLPDWYPDRWVVIRKYRERAEGMGFARRDATGWPIDRQAGKLWLEDGGDPCLLPILRMRTRWYESTGNWGPPGES